MKSTAKLLSIVVLVALTFASDSSLAQSFRFTVSADNRPYDGGNRNRFQWAMSEMERLLGDEGVFHIMPGDFDDPQTTDVDLKAEFGSETIWYPVVGNHEAETPADMDWTRNAYAGLPYIVNQGPVGSETTTYSFDYGNAHFIALNIYFDGIVDNDAAGGDVVDALYSWLVADLDANTKPVVFVIGHEPAYPENRHIGDSLDQFPANRDRFWQLLNERNVAAYFCGHTHVYSTEQRSVSGEPALTWQVDVGNSGNPSIGGNPQTFVDITVNDTDVTYDVYQGEQGEAFTLTETWTVSLSAPQAGDDSYSVAPDTQLIVNAPGVLTNDFDPNGDPLSALPDGAPSNGSLNLNTDGSFDYTPDPGFSGIDTFTYYAWDGANGSNFASVAINVSSETTVTFQQGVSAYSGTVDTNLMESVPDGNYAAATSLTVDADEPSSSGQEAQALLRFDSIMGTAPNQIPPDAPIISATLTLNTTNPGSGATLHRMVQAWVDTDSWNDWGAGIQADDVEAVANADLNTGAVSTGTTVLDVTSSVQAWADNQPNQGWVFIPLGTDGWDFDAAEGATAPLLTVTYSNIPPPDPPAAPTNLVATGEPGQIYLDWDDNSEPSLAGYDVYRSLDEFGEYTLINVDTAQHLDPTAVTANTGEKPQSKVWLHDSQWWSVLADATGTWLRRLDGSTWNGIVQLSSSTSVKADCKSVGDVTHIAMVDGASIQLASVEYVAGQPDTYQLWSMRPSLAEIAPSGAVETATIDIDSTGRMWCAYAYASSIEVKYSDSPYATWSGPVILESGLHADDIGMVTALADGSVGVLWSNQNTKRFGFMTHVDGTDASTWSNDEVPASQSANDSVGLGMADDHLNTAVASDGTLYAAVKTSYDTAGYPKIALLVRHPDGTWEPLHEVDTAGTRPIVVLDESAGRLFVVYTSSEGYNDIVYRESALSSIAFGEQQTILTGGLNNVTSTKQNAAGEILLLASSSTEASGVLMSLAQGPDLLLSEYIDESATPVLTYYYFVRAFDSIGQESVDSNVASDAALLAEVENLTATTISGSQIDLAWVDNATAETGFVIESSLNGVTWIEIDTVGPDVTTYSDTGLIATTTHLYRVRASHGASFSDFSNVASATTLEGNYPPVANDDNARTDMDTAVDIDVLANDSDPNSGDTLTVSSILVDPPNGSAIIINNGLLVTYTPNPGFGGTDTFTYEVTDGEDVASATVIVVVNMPPTAVDDTASTSQGLAIDIDVLANDTDGEGDDMSITNLTQPPSGEGTAEISVDDTITFTPDPGFLGETSFTYTASDGSLDSNVATVTVTVTTAVPTDLFYDGFESGDLLGGGWTSSGVTHVRDEGVVGVYCVRTNMTAWVEKAISTEGYRNIEVEYHRRTAGLDSGELLFVEWSVNGTDWNLLESTSDTTWGFSSMSCGAGAENQPGFRLRFRSNANKNKEYTYIDEVRIIGTASAPDTEPPTPDPMEFADLPYATGATSISMTATTASDPSGVQYLFECTAGGGNNSAWQDSPVYEDTGLSPETQYTYRVKARDTSPTMNETGWSVEAAANTDPPAPPDTTPPTPDPMTWAVAPQETGSTSISMTATTATDPSGVEYSFTCTAEGGHDSGWQDSPTYEDTGLLPDTQYSYTVMARDKSVAQNETGPSAEASATTQPQGTNTIHVHAVDLRSKKAGKNYFLYADVEIRDQSGTPVEGATVSGAWSGDATGTSSGVTDATGMTTLSLKVSGPGSYSFAVTDVVLSGYTYDPASNNTPLIETDVTIP